MKNMKIIPIILLLLVTLAACNSGQGNAPEEGFDFSEEEAAEAPPEEMVFTEDEAEEPPSEPGFDFTEDEFANDPGSGNDSNNDEDQNAEPANNPHNPSNTADEIFPPAGVSNWVINYDAGTITCPAITPTFKESPPDTVTIEVGVDSTALIVKGMEEAPEIFFLLMNSGPGGSQYNGWYTVPDAKVEIHYQMLFTNLSDPNAADFILGDISSTTEGCQVARSFGGTRVD